MALIKISSIPQIYRNVARWREILATLSKYGLADWVSRFDLEFAKGLFKSSDGQLLAKYTRETRIRLALEELGPTAMKLGQILSTRPDLVGVKLATELESLQDQAPATPAGKIRELIEADLGQSIEELFDEFEEEPMASASIGQVHAARLKSGEAVVVKVQHPRIEKKIRIDLDILSGLALLAERIPEFAYFRPRATVAEFQRTLLRELDFGREERHMTEFRRNFADDLRVLIPQPYADLCTNHVLTMQRLSGVKLSETAKLRAAGADLEEIARRGADLYMEMIFTHGFYHADPHPGNILVLHGNVIGLLDFGMVGRIDETMQEDFEEMLMAIAGSDAMLLTSIVTRLGEVPPGLDQAALGLEVSDFVSQYANQPLERFDLSGALNDMMEIIRRYHIRLPARVALLIKVLVMLEGTATRLSPQFNLIEVMRPFQRRMLWRRMSPARQVRKLRRWYAELEHLADVLPRGLKDIMQQVQSGRFDVHLDHRGLEPSVNRLVLGMLASALFLGSSLLLSRSVPPLINLGPWLRDLSLLGLSGCAVSIALGLRLLRAINKSGHLDRRR